MAVRTRSLPWRPASPGGRAGVTVMIYPDAEETIQRATDGWKADTAAVAEEESRRIVPVDTGYLRSTITSNVTPTGFTLRADAHYAYYVAKGTSRMPARDYITPAVFSAIAITTGRMRT